MPYRRLPNTDLARLHALQNAIQRAQIADYTEQVLPYKVQSEAQRFLVSFENTVMQSKDNYTSTVNANKQYRHIVQNARMYISHGKKIIEGEQKRMANGGFPIYNPAINKVKVHYDIFCEHQRQHTFHVQNTERVHGDLEPLRKQADELILNIWNLVEEYYRNELPYAKMMKCQLYGVIYYYRKGERKLTAEGDREIQRIRESQPTIQWIAEE